MKIGIIGTGRVGTALAGACEKAGFQVKSANRSSDVSPLALAQWADIVVLAVPWSALNAITEQIAPANNTIIIDCTNPVQMGESGLELAIGHQTSGAEELQKKLPQARIVKTLNQVGAEIMAGAITLPSPPIQFVAGNDQAAKQTVKRLLEEIGFDPLDAGNLAKARLLEPLALVWINQAMAQGKGRNWGFTIVEHSS